jgi:GAF domain-containing protein
MGAVDDGTLAGYFAELSRRLLAVEGVDETMRLLVDSAVEAIDGCDHASISHLRGSSLVSAASNDDIGHMLDGIQTGADEGPCLDSVRTGEIVVSDDLEHDERWPIYGPKAVESSGVRSSMAHPLHDGRRTLGALNLFSESLGTFDAGTEQEALVAIFSAHATAALAAALHREGMQAALESRDLIGQAKGMLMERTGIGADEAFRVLARTSQRLNVKVAEVARRFVAGDLDDPPA